VQAVGALADPAVQLGPQLGELDQLGTGLVDGHLGVGDGVQPEVRARDHAVREHADEGDLLRHGGQAQLHQFLEQLFQRRLGAVRATASCFFHT